MTKTVRRSAVLILALSLACATSQQATAYKTLGTLVELVDTGMTVYGDQVRHGKIAQAEQDKVRKAYLAYQKVIGPVIKAKGMTAGVPADVAAAADALVGLLTGLGVLHV